MHIIEIKSYAVPVLNALNDLLPQLSVLENVLIPAVAEGSPDPATVARARDRAWFMISSDTVFSSGWRVESSRDEETLQASLEKMREDWRRIEFLYGNFLLFVFLAAMVAFQPAVSQRVAIPACE